MFIHVPVQGCCLGGRVGSMLWVGELATPWRRGLCLRPPRCVSTGPVVVRLAGMANEREREREPPRSTRLSGEVVARVVGFSDPGLTRGVSCMAKL